jgi:Ca2+-binding RTX toxin-like protein
MRWRFHPHANHMGTGMPGSGNIFSSETQEHSLLNLNKLTADYAYDIFFGNDNIKGEAGNDLVVGDFAVIAKPTLVMGASNATFAYNAERIIRDSETYLHKKQVEDQFNGQHRYFFSLHNDYAQRAGFTEALTISAGNDVIDGGSGDDILLGDSQSMLSLAAASLQAVHESFDLKFLQQNHLSSSLFGYLTTYQTNADIINGGDGNDHLYGQQGRDVLQGDAGNDVLYGGTGVDTVDGGAGTDNVNTNGAESLTQADLDLIEAQINETIAQYSSEEWLIMSQGVQTLGSLISWDEETEELSEYID